VRTALLRYRVMANVVGVLLVVLILVGVPLKYLADEGTRLQSTGEWITQYLGVAHGWLYMIFLVTAFLLSRKARWSIGFTIVTLLCGTVPILSFWAEHRATAQALIDAYSADREAIAAQLGHRALDDILAAHRLWVDWLDSGRVRKLALTASAPGSARRAAARSAASGRPAARARP